MKKAKECKQCLLPPAEGRLSHQGYCMVCSMDLMLSSIRSMVHKEGPAYDRWLRGMALSVQRAQEERDAKDKQAGSNPPGNGGCGEPEKGS